MENKSFNLGQMIEDTQAGKPVHNREEYRAGKNSEREEVRAIRDTMLEEVFSGSDAKYRAYLDAQLNHMNQSAGNTLLIMAQMPEASHVLTRYEWQQEGRTVPEDKLSEGIKLIKQSNGYYNVQMAYDISRTEGKPFSLPQRGKADIARAIAALLKTSPMRVYEDNSINEDDGAVYDHGNRRILIRGDLEPESTFNCLAYSVSLAIIAERNPRSFEEDYHMLAAYGSSYMIHKHYGVDTGDFDFTAPTKFLYASPLPQDFGGALNRTKLMAQSVIQGMRRELEKPAQSKPPLR